MKSLSITQPNNEQEAEQMKILLSDITELGKTKENLDSLVSNHEAHAKKYNDILSLIKTKETEYDTIAQSIEQLKQYKASIDSDIRILNEELKKKQALLADIEKHKKIVSALQDDIKMLETHKATIKNENEKNVKEFTDQLNSVRIGIEGVINRIQ